MKRLFWLLVLVVTFAAMALWPKPQDPKPTLYLDGSKAVTCTWDEATKRDICIDDKGNFVTAFVAEQNPKPACVHDAELAYTEGFDAAVGLARGMCGQISPSDKAGCMAKLHTLYQQDKPQQ